MTKPECRINDEMRMPNDERRTQPSEKGKNCTMTRRRNTTTCLIAGLVCLAVALPAAGAEDEGSSSWLESAQRLAAGPAGETGSATDAEPAGWTKPIPVSFSIDYTLVSDYVFRGVNFSEYPREGREKLNHQLGIGFEIDTADLGLPIGVFGASMWFEWYAGQQRISPWTGSNLQEADYVLYWKSALGETGLELELGWIAYHFPFIRKSGSPIPSDFAYTNEAYVTVSYDDSKLFGTDSPVLSPYVSYYQDVDDIRGGWLEIGVGHDFALADCAALKDTPILKDLTVSPLLVLGIDHRWYDKAGFGADNAVGTRLGNLTYGLNISYDLSGALGLPEQIGSLTVAGFLNYCQSFHDDSPAVGDEFYGGMTVGWAW